MDNPDFRLTIDVKDGEERVRTQTRSQVFNEDTELKLDTLILLQTLAIALAENKTDASGETLLLHAALDLQEREKEVEGVIQHE